MTKSTPPPDQNLLGRWTPVIVVVVALAGVGAFLAVWSQSGRDRQPAGLSDPFVYDVEKYRHIPEEQIGYRETAVIETGLGKATALAVGPADEIVVGGDRKVLVFEPDGMLRESIDVDGTPLALAVSPEGGLFVAYRNTVDSGEMRWPLARFLTVPGDRARITSIAVDDDFIYVADAGSRGVWLYSRAGEPMGRVGGEDPDRGIPGFNVPSPYFDLLTAPDGLLRIVDPGRHRVTAFTPGGDLELAWGQASMKLEGFGGCCNPSHIAMLPDGSYVTSEKGVPRVKVHDGRGEFVTAVVAAENLATDTEPCDVGADSRGRILALDPGAGVVRIFEKKGGPGR